MTRETDGYTTILSCFPLGMVNQVPEQLPEARENMGTSEVWMESGRFDWKKEIALLLSNQCLDEKKTVCKGSLVHDYFEKEDYEQFSTSEAPSSLQFKPGNKNIFCQFKFPPLSVITGIICGNGLTYPSMPKR